MMFDELIDQRGAACREANIGILLYCLGPAPRLPRSEHRHSAVLSWTGPPPESPHPL
jgi:hypothetical protein